MQHTSPPHHPPKTHTRVGSPMEPPAHHPHPLPACSTASQGGRQVPAPGSLRCLPSAQLEWAAPLRGGRQHPGLLAARSGLGATCGSQGTHWLAVLATLAPGWSPPHPRPFHWGGGGGTRGALPSDSMLLQRSSWCKRARASTFLQPYSTRPYAPHKPATRRGRRMQAPPAGQRLGQHASTPATAHVATACPAITWPSPLRRHHTAAAAAGAAMTTCLTRLWLRLWRTWPQRNPPHAGPCPALTSPTAAHTPGTASPGDCKKEANEAARRSTRLWQHQAMHVSSAATNRPTATSLLWWQHG
jgi:hypothetical protein